MSVSHCLPRGVIKLDSIEKRQVQFLFKYYFMFVHLCTRYKLITASPRGPLLVELLLLLGDAPKERVNPI